MARFSEQLVCPTCGFTDNPVEARFCGQCAGALPTVCESCGASNPPGFRFCGQCANPLGTLPAPLTTRRVVTVLFADVCNYTALTTRLGAERMYMLLDPCLRRLGETVRRFEGTVDKFTGDGLMAVFGMPVALEQHAIQAAYAGLAMFDELALFNADVAASDQVQFQIRIGLASGEVVAGRLGSDRFSDTTVIGDVVNLAARLQQIADVNTIYLHHLTAQTINSLFDVTEPQPVILKGYLDPVNVAVLLGKREHPGLVRGLGGKRTPLVGREKELRHLLDSTLLLKGGMGGVICLVGEAGVGKSRLTSETLNALNKRHIKILEGECSSATRFVPYSAFLGIIRDMCGILPTDTRAMVRDKINGTAERSAVGAVLDLVPYMEYLLSIDLVDESLLERVNHLDPAQLKRQVFLTLREIILAEARQQPVMLVIDDLQWVDEVSTELIAYLADALDSTPLLLYLVARNETTPLLQSLLSTVLSKAEQRGAYLKLDRLLDTDLTQMAKSLLPNASATMIEHLAVQAEGVPFYLEELARHALEVGIDLQVQSDDELKSNLVPLSLQALMRARYDRLPDSLATTLAHAAVIGRHFGRKLLHAIEPQPELDVKLEQLRERGFICPYRSRGTEWTFVHKLTQETVYASMLAAQRSAIHAKVGLALEQQAGERIDEQVDTLAFHFARSHHVDKAIHYSLLAAERAAGRFANDEALRLYSEVETLLADHLNFRDARVALYRGRGDVLALTGRYDEAREAYQTALAAGAVETGWTGTVAGTILRHLAMTYEKQGHYNLAMHHLELARTALADGPLLDHARIDADAGWVAFLQGDLDKAERLLQMAFTVAQLEQHHSLQATAANRLAGISWQRGQLQKAGTLVAQSLRMSLRLNDQGAVAKALNNLGVIAYDQSDWVAAEDYYTQSMNTYINNGDINGQIRTALNAANATLMRGHLDGALRSLHMTYTLARQIGDKLHMALSRTHQGRISFFVGDLKWARQYLIEAECIFRAVHGLHVKRSDVAELLGRIAFRANKPRLALLLARKAERFAQGNDTMALFRARRLQVLIRSANHDFMLADTLLTTLNELRIDDMYEKGVLKLVEGLHAEHQANQAEASACRSEAARIFAHIDVPKVLQKIV